MYLYLHLYVNSLFLSALVLLHCCYLLQSRVINNLNKQPKINTDLFKARRASESRVAPRRANLLRSAPINISLFLALQDTTQ